MQDWDRFGEEIIRTVQNAVDTQNFSRLNQTISNTVNQAMYSATQGVRNMGQAMSRQDNGTQYNRNEVKKTRKITPMLYKSVSGIKLGGTVMIILGSVLGFVVLLGLIGTVTLGALFNSFGLGQKVASSILTLLLIGSGAMVVSGNSICGKVKRFKTYIKALGMKEYGDIVALAEAVGKSPKFVVKDIRKMIEKKWFIEGHLDKQGTCFIVSNDMYDEYLKLEDQMKAKKIEEEKLQKLKIDQETKYQSLPENVQDVIRRGDEYVEKIRKCNDAIPGEEISAKISRIELLVDRIFDHVEKNPECVGDIRKLMEYYLPTTVKLLEAYEKMDAEPAGGSNIQTAKKEIESTLDTLNIAFEKLLDDLFLDTAWDISSDISVLHTMLAQEGLTEDEVSKRKK